MATKLSQIPHPATVPDLSQGLSLFMNAVRDTIEVREGRRRDARLQRAVTLQDLVDLGLITEEQANAAR